MFLSALMFFVLFSAASSQFTAQYSHCKRDGGRCQSHEDCCGALNCVEGVCGYIWNPGAKHGPRSQPLPPYRLRFAHMSHAKKNGGDSDCAKDNGRCKQNDDCCSRNCGRDFQCYPEKVEYCSEGDEPCAANNHCCSNVCSWAFRCHHGKMKPRLPYYPIRERFCKGIGQECHDDRECCTQSCGWDARCSRGNESPDPDDMSEDTCYKAGHRCYENAECCSRVCGWDSRCLPGDVRHLIPDLPDGYIDQTFLTEVSCYWDGHKCYENKQCCSKICDWDFHCHSPASRQSTRHSASSYAGHLLLPDRSCSAPGEQCILQTDCCSGICGWDKTCHAQPLSAAQNFRRLKWQIFCRNPGNKCLYDGQCCHGICDNSICALPFEDHQRRVVG